MLEFVSLAVVLLDVALLVAVLLPVDVLFMDFSVDPVLDELVPSAPMVEFALLVVLAPDPSVVLPPSSIGVGTIDGKGDTVGNSVGAIDGISDTVGDIVGSIPSGKSVGASVSLLALDTKCANETSKSAHCRRKSLVGAMVTVGFYSTTLRLLSSPAGMGLFFRTIAECSLMRWNEKDSTHS